MNKTINIGIVTGTRAEYGLLSRTIELLQKDERFQTYIFVCGTHLSPEFGYTITELEKNGVKHIIPIEMLMSSSSRVGIAKSVGVATISFADAFSRQSLDAIMVLGDRYEILAAAQTAMFLDICLIHIHGGEVTEGAFDDAIRHSITKMANVHFPTTDEFAKRIRQLGENENSIFTVGSPGVDNIINIPRMNKFELEDSLGFQLNGTLALITYHPVTKAKNANENDITPLIEAIKNNPQLIYIITYPNADGGGKGIIKQWESISHLNNVKIVPSLGFLRYLSLMELVECVIGNSSSGIIEAPSFNVSTINIGSRQHGRPKALSVLDVEMKKDSISKAIHTSCSLNFKESIKNTINPYGQGGTALIIVDLLSKINFSSFKLKKFMDLNINE
jgi:UDP-hydrolysing UDP-N-acetyl-D-glucosamine 2-epimerase